MKRRWFLLAAMMMVIVTLAFRYEARIKMTWDRIVGAGNLPEATSASRIRRCYVLETDGWLTFQLPPAFHQIRILTNADVPEGTPHPVSPEWRYGVQVRLIGEDTDRPLKDTVYHHSTLKSMKENPATGKPESGSFYLDPGIEPADGRFFYLHSDDFSERQPRRLQIRLAFSSPPVSGVVVRVHIRDSEDNPPAISAWFGLTPEERDKLAAGNVFPQDLVTDSERLAMLKRMWRPIAPTGIMDRDYHVKRLYVRQDLGDTDMPDDTDITRNDIGPVKRRVFLVKPPGGPGRFLVTGSPQARGSFQLKHYRDKDRQMTTRTFSWQGEPMVVSDDFQPGLMAFSSAVPLHVISESNGVILSPDMFIRAYGLSDEGAAYRIFHAGNQPALFRLDMRLMVPRLSIGPHRFSVEWQEENAAGDIVSSGKMDLVSETSEDDSPLGIDSGMGVTATVKRFFRLPPDVSVLRLRSSSPVWAAGYTRPYGMVQHIRIPESRLAASSEDPDRRPFWFPMLPRNARAMVQKRRSVLFSLQPSLPAPDKKDPVYRVEGFEPTRPWTGQHMMIPVTPDSRWQSISPGLRFSKLRPAARYEFEGRFSEPVISPRLFVLNPLPASGQVDLSVGSRHLSRPIYARQGIYGFSPIPAGAHAVRFSASNQLSGWISHTRNAPDQLLRYAYALAHQPVVFPVRMDGASVEKPLNLVFYSAGSGQKNTELLVRIHARPRATGMPRDRLGIAQRRYIISPKPGPRGKVINTSGKTVCQGQHIAFPVDPETPAGTHQVSIKHISGPGGYVSLFRVWPGETDIKDIWTYDTSDAL